MSQPMYLIYVYQNLVTVNGAIILTTHVKGRPNEFTNSLTKLDKLSEISLMYIRKSKGSNTEPWVTPALSNPIRCKYQSGFVPGCSTVHQLIEIFHKICISLDKKEFFCSVFCDISKAFDRVWHKGLTEKLKSYGLSEGLVAIFK
jgi:hypothetical protein